MHFWGSDSTEFHGRQEKDRAFHNFRKSETSRVTPLEIIDELEPTKRGPYGGAVGYIGFDGNLDTCITIRTIVCREGRCHVQAGAGVVADSDPEAEFEETQRKAAGMFRAIEVAAQQEDW